MKTKPYPIAMKSACVCSSFLCATMLLVGCSGSKVSGPRTNNPDAVALNDFIDPNASEPTQNNGQSAPAVSQEPPIQSDELGDGITLTQRQHAGEDPQQPIATRQSISQPIGSLSLLEAKVGDVNGKPIFTNAFFAPIEDRLTAEAARLSLSNWRNSAVGTISDRLNGIIADELLRAEALTALTPTQRVGLQAFMKNFRSNLLSENLGSSQLASQRIQQREGRTLDEALRQKEIDTLVQLTLIQEVNRRVNVSWKDIKQRYERDIDEYSPPPTAILRVIRAFADDSEKVQEIQTQLDNGTDFVHIAAGSLNNYNAETDGMHTVLIDDTFKTTHFFGPDILNEHTQKLAVGEMVGPIELGTTLYWIKLMDIEQETISLYDAQLKIQRDLSSERRLHARDEYLNKLMGRDQAASREAVLVRLLQIAEARYGPRG
ncbi:MAG: peptidyl-prolyl cis-trans isomerase [Phycisphaerales bacterium]|nr:peptidyl-prolyl cis-trans isomerase [Phycisphaerales bacterium]